MSGHTRPPDLRLLSDPRAMAAAGATYAVECFADKTPGGDSGRDALHTFVRAGIMVPCLNN